MSNAEEKRAERYYSAERANRLGFCDLSLIERAPASFTALENKFLREVLSPFDEASLPLADVGGLGKIDKRSEALSWIQLGQLYVGRDEWLTPEEEEEEDDVKRPRGRPKGSKTKKSNTPKPLDALILGEYRNFKEWLDLRDKARKDLLFLGTTILKNDFIERVHRPVADMFVQKNFDGVYFKGYTLKHVHNAIDRQVREDAEGRSTKESLILFPRGFYKSYLNMTDCIQWMLNVPDIRILIMTAKRRLANDFVKYIKGKLYLSETAEPTDFQLLFPEYVLRKASGRANTPILLRCRKIVQVEPTVCATSIESGWAGVHCDIKKNDDVVDEKNSNNEDTRQSLKDQIDNSDNLRGAWGFTDNIGTRYLVDDWYGSRLQIRDEKDQPIKYFCRACWTVKSEFENIPLKQLEEHMVDLIFPEISSNPWRDLKKKLDLNTPLFRCQQLNEPALSEDEFKFKINFTEDDLRKHSYSMQSAPKNGDIFIAWDWALTANKKSDYSAGVVARRFEKDGHWGLCVLDVVIGQFTLSQLAQQIAQLDKKWNPKETLIEAVPGVELFQREMMMWYQRLDVQPRITWKTPSNEPDAKRNRIKQLEILLKKDLLWFVFGPWIDQTFSQFVRYTGIRGNMGRHDDIPDAMSHLYYYLPDYVPSTEDMEAKQKMIDMQRAIAAQADFHKRIFGGWGDPMPSQQAPATPEQVQPSNDPRNRIFGGNGLHV